MTAERGLAVGSPAPDFTLRDQFGQDVTLSSFRGSKAVALVFYPYAFSGVCTGEMTGVRGVSCDPVYALRAFADSDGLNFPLLSDFWPHGEVTRAYAVFDEARGCPFRSSYVLDKEGVVRWAMHNEGSQERDLGAHLAQLEALA